MSQEYDYENGKITGLILARGTTPGLSDRNIRTLSGRPLIAWSLTAMKDSGVFDRIYVSTNDDEVASLAKKYGAQVFRRKEKKDDANTTSVDEVKDFLLANPEIQMLCLVQCTSPCLHPHHLGGAVKMLREKKYDSIFSVYRQKTFRWKIVEIGSSTGPQNFDPKFRPRRQDWSGELHENGSFYISNRHLIMSEGSFQKGRCIFYEMPEENSTEIKSDYDFELAHTLVKKYGYQPLGSESLKHDEINSVENRVELEAYTGA